MFIKMLNLYGTNHNAWYRELGNGCFDFVNDKKFASNLSEEECAKVMSYKDWYCRQYGASTLIVKE